MYSQLTVAAVCDCYGRSFICIKEVFKSIHSSKKKCVRTVIKTNKYETIVQ